jgi:hypothetical protein
MLPNASKVVTAPNVITINRRESGKVFVIAKMTAPDAGRIQLGFHPLFLMNHKHSNESAREVS